MKYLCGCEDRPNYRTTFSVRDTLVLQPRDSEGFLVCPEHGEREYGWRTKQSQERKMIQNDRPL